MDAVEYLKERERMLAYDDNDTSTAFVGGFYITESTRPKIAVKRVKAWSKEHPRLTNAQKFEEVFGDKPENMCPVSWWDAEYKATEVRDG